MCEGEVCNNCMSILPIKKLPKHILIPLLHLEIEGVFNGKFNGKSGECLMENLMGNWGSV